MGTQVNELKLESLAYLLPKILDAEHGYVYLQGDHPWTENSLGLLFYIEPYDEDPLSMEDPEFVASNNLQVVMTIGRAASAIRNAYNQKAYMKKARPSIREAVACFNFHYVHDGFLDLEEYNSSES